MESMVLPFMIDSYGKVGSTTNPDKLWMDRVAAVLGTSSGERVMRPRWGLDMVEAFYTCGEDEEEAVVTAIQSAFANHLPLLTLEDIVLERDLVDHETMVVRVEYSRPGAAGTQQLTVGIPGMELGE